MLIGMYTIIALAFVSRLFAWYITKASANTIPVRISR